MRGQRETHAVAVLDVGSSKIVAAVAQPEESGLRVLGVGRAPAAGIRRGAVVDIPQAAAAMAAAVARARRAARLTVSGLTLGSAGGEVWSCTRQAEIRLDGPQEVEEVHVARLMREVRDAELPGNYQVVHSIPLDYQVDGYEGCSQPLGITAEHVAVSAHLVACQETVLSNLWKAAGAAGVPVEEFALSGLAAAEAVLSDAERQVGVVVADLGAEATQVTVFVAGEPVGSAVIPLGGAHVSRDVGAALGIGPEAAEAMKVRHGTADASTAADTPLEWPQGSGPRPDAAMEPTERGLCQVVRARQEEILERIGEALEAAGVAGRTPGGIVFTGGGSRLRGLSPLSLHVLGMRVRCGGAMGAAGTLGEPEFAAAVGLLQVAARRETGERRLPPLAETHRVAVARWWRRAVGG